MDQNIFSSIVDIATSVVKGVIDTAKSIALFIISGIEAIFDAIFELTAALIRSIYGFALMIANDPVVKYVARALVAEPIIALAKFIGTAFLAAYAFITSSAVKYYLFVTYLMPIISVVYGVYETLRNTFYLFWSSTVYYLIYFAFRMPLERIGDEIAATYRALKAYLNNPAI